MRLKTTLYGMKYHMFKHFAISLHDDTDLKFSGTSPTVILHPCMHSLYVVYMYLQFCVEHEESVSVVDGTFSWDSTNSDVPTLSK